MNKISKLFARFRHSHLINCGLRVDLQESGEEFGRMNESICFEILEASKEKIKVKVYHVIYDEDGTGRHHEDSYDIYEIDLTKDYNERNVKFLGNEFKKKRRR